MKNRLDEQNLDSPDLLSAFEERFKPDRLSEEELCRVAVEDALEALSSWRLLLSPPKPRVW